MADQPLPGREVIFELHRIGNFIKITAIDTASMTEVIMQGPLSASEHMLKQNALKKLEYVLKKKGLIR